MNPDWIIHPLTQCILLAAGLIACLYLILVTNSELYSLKRKTRRYQYWTESAIRELTGVLGAMQRELGAPEHRQPTENFKNVIQMAWQGRSPDEIASKLRLPISEVKVITDLCQLIRQLDGAPVHPEIPAATSDEPFDHSN